MFSKKSSFTEKLQDSVTGDQQQSVGVDMEHDCFLGTTTSSWATCFSSRFMTLSLSCKNEHLWYISDFIWHLHEIAPAWSYSSRGNLGPKPPWMWHSTSESKLFLQENTKTRIFFFFNLTRDCCFACPNSFSIRTSDRRCSFLFWESNTPYTLICAAWWIIFHLEISQRLLIFAN